MRKDIEEINRFKEKVKIIDDINEYKDNDDITYIYYGEHTEDKRYNELINKNIYITNSIVDIFIILDFFYNNWSEI